MLPINVFDAEGHQVLATRLYHVHQIVVQNRLCKFVLLYQYLIFLVESTPCPLNDRSMVPSISGLFPHQAAYQLQAI